MCVMTTSSLTSDMAVWLTISLVVPSPTPSFSSLLSTVKRTVLSSDEKLGVGLGTRLADHSMSMEMVFCSGEVINISISLCTWYVNFGERMNNSGTSWDSSPQDHYIRGRVQQILYIYVRSFKIISSYLSTTRLFLGRPRALPLLSPDLCDYIW